MKTLLGEIEANFDKFGQTWRGQLNTIGKELEGRREEFHASYRRLTSLQAWRSAVVSQRVDEGSLDFFLEAQNDGLVSHVLASLGSWRAALKALRSAMENVCMCLYYMDHPIEFVLWTQGRHRLGFTMLLDYLEEHPAMRGVPKDVSGLDILSREYSVLSRAVHASAVSFRMTADMKDVELWSADQRKLGGWLTRERECLCGINLVLLTVFRGDIQGTKAMGLRQAVSLVVPAGRQPAIQKHLGITLVDIGEVPAKK